MKGGNEILHIKDRIKEKLQEWNGFWLDKDSASTSIIWALVFSCCILVLDSYGAFTYCKNQYGVFRVYIVLIFSFLILAVLVWKWNWWKLLQIPHKNSADASMFFIMLSSLMIGVGECIYKTLYCYKLLLLGALLLLSSLVLRWRWRTFFRNAEQDKKKLVDLLQLLNGELHAEGQPILFSESTPDKDLLGRQGLVNMICNSVNACNAEHAYVIGIKGAWGSGKTTILNIAKKELREKKEKIIIIDEFDPWIFGTQEALLTAMYDEILSKTGLQYSSYRNRIIARKLQKTVADSKKLLGVFDVFLNDEKTAYETVKQLKQNLARYLCFIDKKIVLVIDNIDRAEADNILFLFKLIGAVFDLPNILYILSYDDKRIKAVFEDEKKINPKYIEKIVQQEIAIPDIQKERLETICDECIKNLLQCYGVTEDWLNQYTRIIQVISTSITSLRQLKRLFNTAFVTTFYYDNILFKPHLLAIETIRFLEPELYETIKSNPQFFISRDFGIILSRVGWNGSRQEFNTEGKRFFEELFQKFEQYEDLLAELFPYVQRYKENQELKSERFVEAGEEKHITIATISSIKYFDLYFSYGTNDHLEIMSLVNNFIISINGSKEQEGVAYTQEKIIKLPKERQREWLECLQNKTKELDKDKRILVAKGICNVLTYIDRSPSFRFGSVYQRALIVATKLAGGADTAALNDFVEACSRRYNILALEEMISDCKSFRRTEDHEYQELQLILERKYDELCNQIIEQKIDLYEAPVYQRFQIWSLYDAFEEKEKIHIYMKAIVNQKNLFRVLADVIEESDGIRGHGYTFNEGKEKLLFGEIGFLQSFIENVTPQTETEKFILKLRKNKQDIRDENSRGTEYLVTPFNWNL